MEVRRTACLRSLTGGSRANRAFPGRGDTCASPPAFNTMLAIPGEKVLKTARRSCSPSGRTTAVVACSAMVERVRTAAQRPTGTLGVPDFHSGSPPRIPTTSRDANPRDGAFAVAGLRLAEEYDTRRGEAGGRPRLGGVRSVWQFSHRLGANHPGVRLEHDGGNAQFDHGGHGSRCSGPNLGARSAQAAVPKSAGRDGCSKAS